jgi:flagellar protein FlgJ
MTAPVDNASFYASFAELNALKREAKTQSKDSVRAAAQQFESLFTQMMLKSMRDATKSIGDQLAGSNEVDFYQSMFDQQIASQLSKGKGLGLADLLVQQLTRSGLVQNSQGSAASSATSTNAAPASGTPETTSKTTAALSTSREDFVRKLWPHAEKAAQTLGVAPGTLVAQAALETGWGKNVPCNADGSSSYNLFGIKASTRWQGDAIAAHTTEYEQGQAVSKMERFKSYESLEHCFDDYAALVQNSPRYASARNSGADSARFAQALQQGGYATDPRYAQKLQAVADGLNSWMQRAAQDSSSASSGRNIAGGVSS